MKSDVYGTGNKHDQNAPAWQYYVNLPFEAKSSSSVLMAVRSAVN